MELTYEEMRMDKRAAENKRAFFNDEVSRAYRAWDKETDLSAKTRAMHLRNVRIAEHKRTMHELFMCAMGWI